MASLYLDHDVPVRVAELLSQADHAVTTAHNAGLSSAPDDLQLLRAYRLHAILVTRNRKDFLLLHGAWLRWSHEWAVSPRHSGIVVVPHRHEGIDWATPLIVARIEMLLDQALTP